MNYTIYWYGNSAFSLEITTHTPEKGSHRSSDAM